MSVSAVASVAVSNVSLATSRPVAGGVARTSSAAASPVVINDVKPAGDGQAVTASDIQSRVNGINKLIDMFGHIDWAKLAKLVGTAAAAAGQQQYITSLQSEAGATMASAGKAGVSGVNFTFDKPDASVLLPYPSASGTAALITPATNRGAVVAPSSTSAPNAAVAANYSRTNLPSGLVDQPAGTEAGNRFTFRLNASTQFQSGGASVALAILEARTSSNTATPRAHAAPKHDFFA